MATPVLIPVSEYLNTTYRPDRDYVDGELKERNVGEMSHALLQGILFTVFQSNQRSWGLLPVLEQRVQTSQTRFRIPDICLVRPAQAADPIVKLPPVLCVEVLSKDDSLNNMQQRVDDYLAMGVQHIWLIDPLLRLAYRASASGFERADHELHIPNMAVRVDLNSVFTRLDDLLAGRL